MNKAEAIKYGALKNRYDAMEGKKDIETQ